MYDNRVYEKDRRVLHKRLYGTAGCKRTDETAAEYRARDVESNRKYRAKKRFNALINPIPNPVNTQLKYCTQCAERRERRFFPREGKYWGPVCAYCISKFINYIEVTD